MHDVMRTRLLSTLKSNIIRDVDFGPNQHGYLSCRLVPDSSFKIGDREDGSTVTENHSIVTAFGGSRYTSTKSGYKVTIAPGPVHSEEVIHAATDGAIFMIFQQWIDALELVLAQTPTMRRIRKVEATIENMRADIKDIDAEVELTSKEVEEIKRNLERLRDQLNEDLKTATDAVKIDIEQMKKDIETLKGFAETLPKKAFYEAMVSRLGPLAKTGGNTAVRVFVETALTMGATKLITAISDAATS